MFDCYLTILSFGETRLMFSKQAYVHIRTYGPQQNSSAFRGKPVLNCRTERRSSDTKHQHTHTRHSLSALVMLLSTLDQKSDTCVTFNARTGSLSTQNAEHQQVSCGSSIRNLQSKTASLQPIEHEA